MLITPLPGVGLDDLVQTLDSTRNEAFNLRSGGGPGSAYKRLLGYLEWAGRAGRMVGGRISRADLAALVFNRRYEVLLGSFGNMASSETEVQRVVNDLVSLELDERVKDFDAAIATLKAYKDRWANVGDLLVLDTNFYTLHPKELKDTDLAGLTAAVTPGSAMHVLVPLLVVEELDRLKRHNDTKTRARAALKMLNEVFAKISQDNSMGRLRRADDTPGPNGSAGLGTITMELLFDPQEHERLPDPDAEIVDRALAVQNLAGRPVTMVTYDINMSFRARYAGLQAISPPYPEQDEGQGRRRRGRSDGRPEHSTDVGAGLS